MERVAHPQESRVTQLELVRSCRNPEDCAHAKASSVAQLEAVRSCWNSENWLNESTIRFLKYQMIYYVPAIVANSSSPGPAEKSGGASLL